ncbi:hypothetical protein GW17_00007617 [Ensete ventricosum]|uniref:Uncharacterized protein n=1 Tax=Ensete ventricosum TaxID=4639 RepID=A0A426Y528_ENSVE|nr:hypothetical protein B296_00035969 [Ensete ventricosum]RWW27934.1 hypothetical protein GW17_00007617 [Ensete ventricosum]RZR88826.1 hypothetical protein BHM03_00016461 [Ensete ventricosum]
MANFGGLNTAAAGNVNPNKSMEVLPSPGDSVSSLSFSPKGNYLVATSWDNQFIVSFSLPFCLMYRLGVGRLRLAAVNLRHQYHMIIQYNFILFINVSRNFQRYDLKASSSSGYLQKEH